MLSRVAAAALLAALVCFGARAGAGTGVPQSEGLLDFTVAEQAAIVSLGPWPPPATRDASNQWMSRPAVVAYGRRLFGDSTLSADGRLSCASCHDPRRAFQDGRAVAKGRGAGVRNTPTLLDVADRRWFGWDGAHDSLWAASLAPLVDVREMAARVDEVAKRVRRDAAWRARHRAAFEADLPADDLELVVQMAKALAAYQATLRSPRTAFDRFRDALVRGDRAGAARYPLAAQRGLRLFIGEARCSVCHAGPAFTNDEFADTGVPFFVARGADAGRHGGLAKLLTSRMNRLGEFNDAGERADPRALLTRHLKIEPRHFGEFRVPGLRQLTRTAPYMHNGSLATLEAVVRHYDRLDEERLHADGERILRRLNLRDEQAADLVAFLRTLSR
ncbi:MAG: c-type cytochrome [Burkholderiales bacterium]|nr:c-type cytochrome [Burkholderiales bacterium]